MEKDFFIDSLLVNSIINAKNTRLVDSSRYPASRAEKSAANILKIKTLIEKRTPARSETHTQSISAFEKCSPLKRAKR